MDFITDFKLLTRRAFGEVEKQYTFILNVVQTILNNTFNSIRPVIKRTIERRVFNKHIK